MKYPPPTLDLPAPPHPQETPTQKLDRLVHTAASPLTHGISPISLALAWADWAWHLGVSSGRQIELAGLGAHLALETLRHPAGEAEAQTGSADEDPRFRHEAWATWPFSWLRTGFRSAEGYWREAERQII